MNFFRLSQVLLLATSSLAQPTLPKPPETPKRPVIDEYHGVKTLMTTAGSRTGMIPPSNNGALPRMPEPATTSTIYPIAPRPKNNSKS